MTVTVTACGPDGCGNDTAIGVWLSQPSPRRAGRTGLRARTLWLWWLTVLLGQVQAVRLPRAAAAAGRAPITWSLSSRDLRQSQNGHIKMTWSDKTPGHHVCAARDLNPEPAD